MAQDSTEIRKKLFRSPMVEGDRLADNSTSMNLMTRLHIEHDMEHVYKTVNRDMHEQRLKQLRQKLKTLEEDDWRYQPVDKLIGLQ
ncbi:anaphase-promoting complex subunit 16 [Magallana gigas]|uniref:Anaphase-promoting complex subunit 16 n=1 Tax=Magallana gigas TaxID=29159 RepID=A0A8W8LMK3_MAGGI|nr:anaphase-promoting complex subunit 16-like [Crassostrea gigas]|eukprot:XP_011415608.1 PREDICTED: anaphase-promoting complex subunit 16-like [Crassostrea gigas]